MHAQTSNQVQVRGANKQAKLVTTGIMKQKWNSTVKDTDVCYAYPQWETASRRQRQDPILVSPPHPHHPVLVLTARAHIPIVNCLQETLLAQMK